MDLKDPASGPDDERLGRKLALALKGMRAHLDERLAEKGSSFHSWLVLRHVRDHPGLSQRALAARVGIEGPTLTHHLDRLAADGLVLRVRSADDRRVSSTVLTAAGLDRLRAADEVADGFDAALRSLFPEDEWQALNGSLRRLIEHYGHYGRNTLDHDRTRSA